MGSSCDISKQDIFENIEEDEKELVKLLKEEKLMNDPTEEQRLNENFIKRQEEIKALKEKLSEKQKNVMEVVVKKKFFGTPFRASRGSKENLIYIYECIFNDKNTQITLLDDTFIIENTPVLYEEIESLEKDYESNYLEIVLENEKLLKLKIINGKSVEFVRKLTKKLEKLSN